MPAVIGSSDPFQFGRGVNMTNSLVEPSIEAVVNPGSFGEDTGNGTQSKSAFATLSTS